MALYTKINFDDIASDWDAIQRQRLQQQQQEALQRQQEAAAQVQKAQNQPTGLGAVLAGIGNSIKNVGDTMYNMFGTGAASVRDLLTGNAATGKYTNEWKDYMKETQYGDKNMSDKDYYARTGGKALDAAATVSDLIPGMGTGAKVALNIGQGAASGLAQNYIDNGANVSIEDALKGAMTGAASAGVGQFVGNKLAGKTAGDGILSKAINSNIGKGAITGAASGATGGALASMLNGGDFGQNVSSAFKGAGSGALAGGTMAGIMGVAGSGLDKLNDKITKKNTVVQTPDADTVKVKQTDTELTPGEVAKLERQVTVNKQKQGSALLDQYGELDAPLRRSLGSAEDALVKLYDEYGLKNPADVQYAANHVTGKDGIVTKMTRELAGSAQNVDTKITKQWLDDLIELNGLTDDEAKVVTKQVTAALKRTGDTGVVDGNTALDLIKQLEKQSAQYKGKDGVTYRRGSNEDTRKALVLDLVKDEIQGRVWDAAGDASKVLTPERLNTLKGMYEGNEQWANFVDNNLAKIKNGAQLRSAMKPLVDGAKIVNGSKMTAGGYGERALKAGTSANAKMALTQVGLDALFNSDKAKQSRATKYANNAAKAQAQLNGEVPVTKTSGIGKVARGITKKVGDLASALDSDTLLNARLGGNNGEKMSMPSFGDLMTSQLARQAGIGAERSLENEQNLQNAQQNYLDANNNYNLVNTGVQTALQSLDQQRAAQNNPGAQQLQVISRAMELALNSGDLTSYSKLADLYQQAYKIYGAGTTTGTSQLNNLSNSQIENINKLDTAGNAIDELEQLFNQAGGGQGLIGGNIANWLGSIGLNSDVATYNSISRGLINQIGAAIGKTDSLNTEGEVNRALELIPKMTDDAQTAQNKLNQLRQMLSTNKQTVYQNYGVSL